MASTLDSWRRSDSSDPRKVTSFLRSLRGDGATMLQRVDQLLEEMKDQSLEFNVIQCSAAMTSFREASLWSQALHLARAHAVDAHLVLGCWAAGSGWIQAMDSLQRLGSRTPFVLNAALSACAGASAWQAALLLYEEEMGSADVVCYNTLMSACGKGSEWTLALQILEEMLGRAMQPSNASFSAAISACEKAFRWEEALALLQDAQGQQSLRLQLSCFNALISAMEKCQRWELALQIFQEITQLQLSPDRISYNALLSAFAGAAQWTRSVQFLEQMMLRAVQPGSITRNAVITACENALQWQLVLQILEPNGLEVPQLQSTSASDLHHAAWYLSKQSPSCQTQQQGLRLARQAVNLLSKFKTKELVSLLRSFSSMLVADRALFLGASKLPLQLLTLQTQELANLAWSFASTSVAGKSLR